MANYPARGLGLWDDDLKAYIDGRVEATTAGATTDAGVADKIDNGPVTRASLFAALGPFVGPTVAQAIVDALAAQPSVTAAAAALAQSDAGLIRVGDFRLFVDLDDPIYAFAITDQNGRLGLGLRRSDGKLVAWIDHRDNSVPLAALDAAARAGIAQVFGSDEYLYSIVDANGRASWVTVGLDGGIPAFVIKELRTALGLSQDVAGGTGYVVKTVRTDGTGDYLTPWAAQAALTDTTKTYEVRMSAGVYDMATRPTIGTVIGQGLAGDRDFVPAAHIRYVSDEADVHAVRWRLFQPDDAVDSTITNFSAVRFEGSAYLEGFTIEVKNARYCVHDESANVIKDWKHNLRGMHLEHFGLQGARDWRTANPGSVGVGFGRVTMWSSPTPYGYGASSGGVMTSEDCTFISHEISAWSVHNNSNFADPNINIHKRSRFVTLGKGPSVGELTSLVNTQSLGSGTRDTVLFENCAFDGGAGFAEQDSPWLDLTGPTPSNHVEYDARFVGCTTLAYSNTTRGKALLAQSASTVTGSKVRLSGTAAPVILGYVTERDGGGGMAGYAYGGVDISGIAGGLDGVTAITLNTLSEVLGNRTGAPLTLTVTVDGGSGQNVVLNADYTGMTNAAIIAVLNAAVTGVVFSEYLVGPAEMYMKAVDTQQMLYNADTVFIPRWSAVVRATSRQRVRLMQASDPASAFYGVALEPIPPGAAGLICHDGLYAPGQLRGTTGVTVGSGQTGVLGGTWTDGEAIYASDTVAGGFTKTVGTGRLLGRGAGANFVRLTRAAGA